MGKEQKVPEQINGFNENHYKIMYSMKMFGQQSFNLLVETAGISTDSYKELRELCNKYYLHPLNNKELKKDSTLKITETGKAFMETIEQLIKNNDSEQYNNIRFFRQLVRDRYYRTFY